MKPLKKEPIRVKIEIFCAYTNIENALEE